MPLWVCSQGTSPGALLYLGQLVVEDNFGTATTTMSKFSDAYSNPFEDGGDINPFAYAAQAPASARSQPDTHNSPPATTPIAPSTQSTYIPPPISSDGHVPTV